MRLSSDRSRRRSLDHFEGLEDPDDLEDAQDLDNPQHPRLTLQPGLVCTGGRFALRNAFLRDAGMGL